MEAKERLTRDPVGDARSGETWMPRHKAAVELTSVSISSRPVEVPVPSTHILTRNARMWQVIHDAVRVAPSNATVLIVGETGTGKELLASEIHRFSRRAHKPLTVINCAALAEPLVETELFGHVRGAFTGADRHKVGFFEAADGGTVFLDEIGEIGPLFQLKLLRVLEQREFNRVGDTRRLHTDIRFISATNRDLEAKVREGKFREDLYYRLNVVTLTLPPLRKRKEDIELLTCHFVELFARELDKPIRAISADVFQVLANHDWPGNVRELRNTIQRAVILCDTDVLTSDTLPEAIRHARDSDDMVGAQSIEFDERDFLCPFKDAKEKFLGQFEREYLIFHLKLNNGNVARTAQRTGIYGANLYDKLRRYQIDPNRFRSAGSVTNVVPLTAP